MSENTLLTAFIVFTILLFFVTAMVRKMNMRDVCEDNSLFSSAKPSPFQKKPLSQNEYKVSSTSPPNEENSALKRQRVYKIAKVISALGIITLFVPLPETYKIIGLVAVFLGSMVSKAFAPPKEKKGAPKRNSVAHLADFLAENPEYREALKQFVNDYNNNALVGEEKYRSALKYLQQKGIPPEEARKNLIVLFNLWAQAKDKSSLR